jgi:hypothetical protein
MLELVLRFFQQEIKLWLIVTIPIHAPALILATNAKNAVIALLITATWVKFPVAFSAKKPKRLMTVVLQLL